MKSSEHVGVKAQVSHCLEVLCIWCWPPQYIPWDASPGTPETGQVNSWDSRREFDPAVTLCSGLSVSPLLGWPLPDFLFVSLCLCLSRSPSHLLSRELREQEGMKRGIVLCWMQAVCVSVCQCFSGFLYSTLALCDYADIAALACHSGQRSKVHVLTSIICTSFFHMSKSSLTCNTHRTSFNNISCFIHSLKSWFAVVRSYILTFPVGLSE